MKIYFASDHAGLELKEKIFNHLADRGYELTDFGPLEMDKNDDYPDYISLASRAVSRNPKSLAIVFGGSGQGEAMMANRFKRVRATVYYGGNSQEIVKLSRQHNNANVLSIGARFTEEQEAKDMVDLWLDTKFEKEERHVRRLAKIEKEARMGLKSRKIERFGWFGVFLILSAYVANIFGLLSVDDSGYLMANIVGSLFVLVDARQDDNMQAVVINVVWVLAGIFGVFRYIL